METMRERDQRFAATANALGLQGYARDNFLGKEMALWEEKNPSGGVSGMMDHDGGFVSFDREGA